MTLLEREIFPRIGVHELPARIASRLFRAAAKDGIAGGRIDGAHIAEVARAARATVIVTDNRRHIVSALRYDVHVETPAEFIAGIKERK